MQPIFLNFHSKIDILPRSNVSLFGLYVQTNIENEHIILEAYSDFQLFLLAPQLLLHMVLGF
jgi:hypothetical protein